MCVCARALTCVGARECVYIYACRGGHEFERSVNGDMGGDGEREGRNDANTVCLIYEILNLNKNLKLKF